MKRSRLIDCLLAIALTTSLRAENARFDLAGPRIDVKVKRGDKTLPIAQVPNLQPGDKLWVKADLPDDQSNHLLLIVAFLRGTTNEPPDNWFTEIDTWDKKHTAEGTSVIVPGDAQQALMFVAPETGGDFKTLRSAVKGRPGLFIRADVDLNEASFEQQRIERYLAAMKTVPQDDPKAIQDHSAKLAATLALKPNADCFKQPDENQVTCLTQSSAPVLLDDGHGSTVAEALSTGASSDFINAASYTSAAGGGLYSAYVGAIDLVHLVSTLHTAKYQYIPGLSFPQDATLDLKLNAPVSFNNPKSVIVIGLPAIQKTNLPPLRPQHPDQVACLLQPQMPLLLQGAPLVFATSFAHDLVLHVNRPGGAGDIPLTPDAFEGGLIVAKAQPRQPLKDQKPDTSVAEPDSKADAKADLTVTGTVKGFWGFDTFDGPTLTLQQTEGKHWKLVGDTQLLAGQDNKLTLKGDGTACIQKIQLSSTKEKDEDVAFGPAGADRKDSPATRDTLALDVSLKKVQPGGYALVIQQYGDTHKDSVPLTAYTSDIHLDAVRLHAGDNTAVLTGEGLGNVAQVEISGQVFTPAADGSNDSTLNLTSKAAVSPGNGTDASAKLKDGRTMPVKIATEAPRPGLELASFDATPAQGNNFLPVALTGKDEIPLNGKLTFVVHSKDAFPRNQTIEVATEDNSIQTILSLAKNSLILQDPHTAIATLEPLKAFGESAFGKLQMRPVAADGTPGNWTQLGTLVRTPQITAVNCTTADAPTCTLEGQNLFLVQSFAAAKEFNNPAEVPSGYAQNTLPVPTPSDGATLFLKLRDDPGALATLTLPHPLQQPSPGATEKAPAAAAVQPAADPSSPPSQAVVPAPPPPPQSLYP